MGSSQSKNGDRNINLDTKQSAKQFTSNLTDALKYLIPDSYKSVHSWLNNPHESIKGLKGNYNELADKLAIAGAFGGGTAVGVAGSFFHHFLHAQLLALVGNSTPLLAVVGQYSGIAASLGIAAVQVYKIRKASAELARTSKLVAEISEKIETILKPEICDLLEKANNENWQQISLDKVRLLLKHIQNYTKLLKEAKDKHEETKKDLKTWNKWGYIIGGLTIIGSAALLATGIGGLVLFGCCCAAGAIALGVSAYTSYKISQQTKTIDIIEDMLQKLHILESTLKVIEKNTKYHQMEPKDFADHFRKKGLSQYNNCDKIIKMLKDENIFVIDRIKSPAFDREALLNILNTSTNKSQYQDIIRDNVIINKIWSIIESLRSEVTEYALKLNALSKEIISIENYQKLLKQWDLAQHINLFKSKKRTSVVDWHPADLTKDVLLNDFKMQMVHVNRFIKKRDEYFQKYYRPDELYEKTLIKWGLGQYAWKFRDTGYEDIQDWKEIKENDLDEMGVKKGHIKKFIRKCKTKEFEKQLSQLEE